MGDLRATYIHGLLSDHFSQGRQRGVRVRVRVSGVWDSSFWAAQWWPRGLRSAELYSTGVSADGHFACDCCTSNQDSPVSPTAIRSSNPHSFKHGYRWVPLCPNAHGQSEFRLNSKSLINSSHISAMPICLTKFGQFKRNLGGKSFSVVLSQHNSTKKLNIHPTLHCNTTCRIPNLLNETWAPTAQLSEWLAPCTNCCLRVTCQK